MHPVTTTEEMLRACRRLYRRCDVLIAAAAVCDYRPRRALARKLKRTSGPWTLELVPTEDVAAELGRVRGHRVHAGFALETEDLLENARKKLRDKRLDWIVANPASAVAAEGSWYLLLGADGTERRLGRLAKAELARVLLDAIEETWGRRNPRRAR